jgi:hypothetical protein
VQAFVDSSVALLSVEVEHHALVSGSFGSWALAPGSTDWWSWAPPPGVAQWSGPPDGTFTVRATDQDGGMAELVMTLQPSQELLIPSPAYGWSGKGFSVTAQALPNADYYHLWVWDPVDEFYPYSATSTNQADLSFIEGSVLQPGRLYRAFFIANNLVDGVTGPYSILYRSYSSHDLMLPASPVPEPSAPLMFIVALSFMGSAAAVRARRRRHWLA